MQLTIDTQLPNETLLTSIGVSFLAGRPRLAVELLLEELVLRGFLAAGCFENRFSPMSSLGAPLLTRL